ncbi:type II toxin-antitoxin system HicB family antitoxin [uncultured Parasutterella sp.]|uniref:type II toxin-antitoxin system HicB family antitoxin n=1 Tax=uncultured Parasutterella sp. TaxID=1263098 RepID=UPI002595C5CD|nr:type II toxin-antitoxin system HicB family antitoxin [uncultured Parasutterella sp.]
MKLIYPAIFYADETSGGYTVEVPDLPGCVTEGDSLEEALEMGVDAASGWILDELEEGRVAPKASSPLELKPEEGGFVSLLTLDIDSYAEKYGDKAVRKNLTIPAWLNTFAESRHINFSDVLQNSLKALYRKEQGV